MWCLLLALAFAGPETASETDAPAHVLAVDGKVEVQRDGKTVALNHGDLLRETDVIVTDDPGSVLLLLKNQIVVRLEEDLEMPFSAIAMRDAPRTPVPVDVQVQQLVSPEVYEAYGERIAGVQARSSATSRMANPLSQAKPGVTRRRPMHVTRLAPAVAFYDAIGPKGTQAACMAEWKSENPDEQLVLVFKIKKGKIKKVDHPDPACLEMLAGREYFAPDGYRALLFTPP